METDLSFLQDEYLFEEQVCSILKIKQSTLAGRRSNGTEHPPYIEMGKVKLYPKAMFKTWLSKRRVYWEVKGAS